MRVKCLIVLSLTCLFGCASTAINQNIHGLSLPDVEKIELGQFVKANALDKFGAPDIRESNANDQTESWLYFNRPRVETRLILIFDRAGKLQKKLWFPKSTDRSITLDSVKSRYSITKFQEYKYPQMGDYIPSESIFYDEDQGIQVLHSEMDGVEGVAWVSPGTPVRQKASQ